MGAGGSRGSNGQLHQGLPLTCKMLPKIGKLAFSENMGCAILKFEACSFNLGIATGLLDQILIPAQLDLIFIKDLSSWCWV